MNDAELLEFHRNMVSIPAVSRNEEAVVAFVSDYLTDRGLRVDIHEGNLFAVVGDEGPILVLCSHLDTVPPAPGWTFAPHQPVVIDGRVYGLGSNDAKASVAAMVAATLRLVQSGGPKGFRLLLALVIQEEIGDEGAAVLVPELVRRGLIPDAVIIGEPTSLDVSVSQKGLLILKLVASGHACHAAHGHALGAKNAIVELAHDICAIEGLEFGEPDSVLGPVTVQPTMTSGGTARNVVPAVAECFLDVRTNPEPGPQDVLKRIESAVSGHVEVVSQRLRPCRTDLGHPIVNAALVARPGAITFGSRGLSDWVFFADYPAVKVGPGRTERSHTPDEFVLESEIIEGADFYEKTARAWAGMVTSGK